MAFRVPLARWGRVGDLDHTYACTYDGPLMVRKLTITVDEDVYTGLHERVGPGRISRFVNDLVRPLVSEAVLLESYRAMAADEERERDADEWCEALLEDVADG